MIDIREEPWFANPFTWYENETDKYVISLPVSDTKALDVLAGLYDIYKSFKRNDNKQGLADLNALATILIAITQGRSNETVNELLIQRATDNIDSFLADVLDEGESND